MKYCISNRQSKQILEKADEIKVRLNDIARLKNYIEDYPDKSFILEIPKNCSNRDCEWSLFQKYADTANFKLAIKDMYLAEYCRNYDIPFYWDYPVFTYYELRSLIAQKPCYIILEAPLSFDLENVKKITDIPIRIFANIAYDSYIPKENGIYGSWIRPEDVKNYEKYVDTLEFFTRDDMEKEATLFHIYKDNESYPGNLNLLFTNLNFNIDNRLIPEDLAIRRMTCGQRCMSHNTCHHCETVFKYAELVKKIHNVKVNMDIEKMKEN